MRSTMHQYGVESNGVSEYDTVDLYELIDNLKSYDTNNIQGRFSETWYVIEPIDGASPDNSTSVDHWTKCDNLEN